ncbi:MAG: serine/threonine-protein kinase [Myxococcales bacterium]
MEANPAIPPTSISQARKLPDSETIPGYRLELLIGKGGMGEVYKATQLSLLRPVAVKLLPAEFAREESFVARFEKEAAALASLSHPNVVSIVDKGKSGETYYLVMEFVGGPSLRDVMREKNLQWTDAIRYVVDIARAIDYAHGRGVIHRDLKPENILFDTQAGFLPKVTDFGLAGFVKGEGQRNFALTDTHVSMGTLAYMAPEQQVNAKDVDGRADLFSLGVMIYELLVGDVPRGHFDPPSVIKPNVDKRLDGIVEKCLRASANDRYGSVAELIACLEPLVPGIVTRAPSPLKLTKLEKAKRAVSRAAHFAVRMGAMALLLCAVLVLTVAGIRARRPPRERLLLSSEAAQELPAMGGGKATGRVDTQAAERTLVLQANLPAEIAVATSGRIAAISGDAISFSNADVSEVGRATIPLAWTDGENVQISALLSPPKAAPQLWATTLRRWILGEAPEPRSALMLQGDPGRYVAVVATSQNTFLEWSLGARRGVTVGPALPTADTRVEIAIGRDGTLRAALGPEKRQQPIGEQIRLGNDWRSLLGGTPQPAVACIEAACDFKSLAFEVRLPPVVAVEVPKAEPKSDPKAADPRQDPKVADPKAKPPAPPPAKTEPKRVEPAKAVTEPKKPDPKKADPKKPDPKKVEKPTAKR